MPTVERHHSAFILRGGPYGRGQGTLIQSDYDYPRVAENCGWTLRRVQTGKDGARFLERAPNRGKGCDHRGTDGTVDCPACGVTSNDFIVAAGRYLDSLAW